MYLRDLILFNACYPSLLRNHYLLAQVTTILTYSRVPKVTMAQKGETQQLCSGTRNNMVGNRRR